MFQHVQQHIAKIEGFITCVGTLDATTNEKPMDVQCFQQNITKKQVSQGVKHFGCKKGENNWLSNMFGEILQIASLLHVLWRHSGCKHNGKPRSVHIGQQITAKSIGCI